MYLPFKLTLTQFRYWLQEQLSPISAVFYVLQQYKSRELRFPVLLGGG
jgi:hypothetical protein